MKKTPTQKPAAQKLYNDQAVNDLVSLLTQFSDPDQVLMEAGLSRADLRRLESDDEISAAMETRVNAVLSTPWRLEPGDGAVYDFVMPQLHEHLEGIINAAWKAVPYGYSVIEAIYRKDSDAIRWDRLEERPFEWFRPTIDGKLRYYPKAGSTAGLQGQQVDTTFKFYLARRRPTYRNPMGEALLSRLYWPWFFRANGWKFWARFLERFGSPLLIGKTEGSTQDMATALAQAVQSAVAAVGSGDAVDVVAPSGSGDSFRLFSDAVDRRIQKVVLGQTLTTDVGSKGSFAAAKVHNEVRDDRRLADVRMISGLVQHMIDALVYLNYPAAEPPKFVMEDDTGLQPDRAERDAKLAQAKVIKFTEGYLLRAYDYEPGDFDIPPDLPAGNAGPGNGPSAKASMLLAASRDRFTPAQGAIEQLADDALAQIETPIPPDKIQAAIKAATSPDDLAERLADVYDGHDPSAFRETLERALFAAEVMGYVHAEEQQ